MGRSLPACFLPACSLPSPLCLWEQWDVVKNACLTSPIAVELFEERTVIAFLQASLFDRSLDSACSKHQYLLSSDWLLRASSKRDLLDSKQPSVHAHEEV